VASKARRPWQLLEVPTPTRPTTRFRFVHMLLFMTLSAVVVGSNHDVTTSKTHPQTCPGTSSPRTEYGSGPAMSASHTGSFECILMQFMPCRLELWCDCTEAHCLVLPAEALRLIAVIVAVALPQVQLHLQPISYVSSNERACFFAG